MDRAYGTITANTANQTLVAAVSGKKIVVNSILILSGGTATLTTFKSKFGSDAAVAISPAFPLGINGGFHLQPLEPGWMETATGAALTIDAGAGSDSAYIIFYSLK